MAKRTRLEQLQADATDVGLGVDTYSSGDGITCYRFWRLVEQRDNAPRTYFSASPVLVTVLGYGNAMTYLNAYATGYRDAMRKE